jgi:DNA invertase Pin-like site-specific DNA recombinase
VPPQRAGLFTSSGMGADGLLAWAERTGRRQTAQPGRGALRFAFYGRVSTEDYQDPVTSRARQLGQAGALVAGHGQIVAHFFDIGQSRALAWARRPQAAGLAAALADPDRGWDAIVIGEYERAFYGSQYAAMAPLFEHYGVQLWMPEAGGRVDYASEHDERAMTVLGLSSKREITRTSIRVRTAMAAQTREQGRYLGGRPPYGYRLADAGPHPNKAHAAWGRRAHRLEPDPETAHVVQWMFAQRLAGHSVARITRALNDEGIPCPSAADPGRNPHRTGAAWALGTVTSILGIPAVRCETGSAPTPSWPTPPTPAWGTRRCSGGTCPTGGSFPPGPRTRRWSARPVSSPPRTSTPPAAPLPVAPWPHRATAGTCWPVCWPAGPAGGGWNQLGPTAIPPTGAATATPAPQCRTPAGRRTPTSGRTASCRTSALHLLTGTQPAPGRRRRTRRGAGARPQASAEDVIRYVRDRGITLTYDPAAGTLQAGTCEAGSPFISPAPPLWLLGVIVTGSAIVAFLSSAMPARRAASVPMLEAIGAF